MVFSNMSRVPSPVWGGSHSDIARRVVIGRFERLILLRLAASSGVGAPDRAFPAGDDAVGGILLRLVHRQMSGHMQRHEAETFGSL
jgi:hypothetical protein